MARWYRVRGCSSAGQIVGARPAPTGGFNLTMRYYTPLASIFWTSPTGRLRSAGPDLLVGRNSDGQNRGVILNPVAQALQKRPDGRDDARG